MTYPMADKMKHVRQVALDYMSLINGPSSQNFGEETMFKSL